MADFDFLSHVQQRNLDDVPAKYYPDLDTFFKIDILLQNFRAKSTSRKMAHPRIPQHSKYPSLPRDTATLAEQFFLA